MIDLSAPMPLIYLWVWAVSIVVVGCLYAGIERRAEPWWEAVVRFIGIAFLPACFYFTLGFGWRVS